MKITGHILPGKVLVRQDDLDEKTDAGVIIPAQILEKPHSGTVVVVGEDTEHIKHYVKVGDNILYADHAGTPLKLEDPDLDLHGDFVLLEQSQVLIYKRKD